MTKNIIKDSFGHTWKMKFGHKCRPTGELRLSIHEKKEKKLGPLA